MNFPKVTVALISYNQENFIRAAAESCLSQDYRGSLEIIFSDDFSTDATFDIMTSIADSYRGPHKVVLRRNSKNVGIGMHYNTVISIATGELIVTAAGDDISISGRVSSIVDFWIDKGKTPDLITSNLIAMDVNGSILKDINVANLADWKKPESWIKKRPYVVGAAHAFTPRLHRKFGDFVPELVYEDQVMAFRASVMGSGGKISIPLVLYRQGGVSQGDRIFSSINYVNWLFVKFSRQNSQYLQIKKDIDTIGRPDLWSGRLECRLNESTFMLDLIGSTSFGSKIKVLISTPFCGLIFKIKYLMYVSWPSLGSRMRNIKKKP